MCHILLYAEQRLNLARILSLSFLTTAFVAMFAVLYTISFGIHLIGKMVCLMLLAIVCLWFLLAAFGVCGGVVTFNLSTFRLKSRRTRIVVGVNFIILPTIMVGLIATHVMFSIYFKGILLDMKAGYSSREASTERQQEVVQFYQFYWECCGVFLDEDGGENGDTNRTIDINKNDSRHLQCIGTSFPDARYMNEIIGSSSSGEENESGGGGEPDDCGSKMSDNLVLFIGFEAAFIVIILFLTLVNTVLIRYRTTSTATALASIPTDHSIAGERSVGYFWALSRIQWKRLEEKAVEKEAAARRIELERKKKEEKRGNTTKFVVGQEQQQEKEEPWEINYQKKLNLLYDQIDGLDLNSLKSDWLRSVEFRRAREMLRQHANRWTILLTNGGVIDECPTDYAPDYWKTTADAQEVLPVNNPEGTESRLTAYNVAGAAADDPTQQTTGSGSGSGDLYPIMPSSQLEKHHPPVRLSGSNKSNETNKTEGKQVRSTAVTFKES